MVNLPEFAVISTGTALMSLLVSGPAAAATFYAITDLPFSPSDLNDRGQVVGQQYLWSSGVLTDLRILPGAGNSPIFATAINDNGLIVGGGLTVNASTRYQAAIPNQAFMSDGTIVKDMGRPFACTDFCPPTTAVDINQTGQVVLNYDVSSYQPALGVYVQNLDGSHTSTQFFRAKATAINNAQQVTSFTFPSGRSGPGAGLVLAEGSSTFLAAPGTCSNFFVCFSASTVANDLNDLGQVVGAGPIDNHFDAPVYALLWNDPKHNPIGINLGNLGGNKQAGYGANQASVANAINNNSEVVGFSYIPSGEQHAFLWKDGTMLDLNDLITADLGWQLTSALKINNRGQIIGTGSAKGQQKGFLLTPVAEPLPSGVTTSVSSVPEPTANLSLLGFGAVAIGLVKRRQHKQVSSRTRFDGVAE